ncbi:MAG: hypothetical protein R3E35_07100 [Rhodocyclaceae bacterium]
MLLVLEIKNWWLALREKRELGQACGVEFTGYRAVTPAFLPKYL